MSKIDVYEMVTNRIISELEKGVIPWEIPWHGVKGTYNRISKKPYSIMNQMLLKHNGEYATFNQWRSIGGKIQKGAKSEFVIFWKLVPKEDYDSNGERIIRQIPILKYYNVFHISQVDGVEPLPQEKLQDIEPIVEVDKILNDYISRENIKFEQTASNEAYYSPNRDLIHLPLFEQFKEAEEYYSTFVHESIHSTMSATRCDRPQKFASFGSENYSKEELVAEIGSATLLNMLGIETKHSFRNSTAYIQSWLQVLKNDVKFIVSASSQAERAVKYILGESEEVGE
jgi:antirestriction protein ArdC